MIQLGRIDPGRIAINGYGFGGYLALCGVSSEPDLYRCAVCTGGNFDMALFMKEARTNMVSDNPIYDLLRRHLGDPGKNAGAFAGISPIRRVDRIKVPVFVAHSQNPYEPSSEQAANLISALKDHHSPYVEWDGEYHERSPGDVLTQEYTAILAFLAKNMGGAPTAH
jgi:dipeptidyl aminopeptidase/acylaminoacyl peptidase